MRTNNDAKPRPRRLPDHEMLELMAATFREMRQQGRKPFLLSDNANDVPSLKTIQNMDRRGFLDAPGEVFYRDFTLDAPLTPEQKTRMLSYTGIQSITWNMMTTQEKLNNALGDLQKRIVFAGLDPFSRGRDHDYDTTPYGKPLLIAPGNFYEAEALCNALARRRRAGHGFKPLFIYSPHNFWAPILRFAGPGLKKRGIHICATPEEVAAAVQAHAPENNALVRFNAISRNRFDVKPGALMAIFSNHPTKRRNNARLIEERGSHVRFRFIGDFTPTYALPNAKENRATGSGNALNKVLEGLALVPGQRDALRKAGFDPDTALGMVSDVTANALQPGLAEHPFMKKYRHVMKPGQAFPGSEMALIERTTNMDTLFHDINRAFDDMESKGIPVDRRIQFQAMIYAFPLNQIVPASPTEEDIRFVAVSGAQIYDIRKTPAPLNYSGNDLDSYLALKEFPDTSIAEMQTKGRMIERTHYARAYQALESVLKFPKKEIFTPSVQRVAKEAVVLTDRHFLGTWTKPADFFTKTQLRDLESHGYRFGDVWEGPRDIDGIEEFRKGAHAFITLPYTYANVFNKEELLRAKLERLLMLLGRDVDEELSDPYVRGRPHLVLDPEYRRLKAFAYRMGLSGKVPAWDSHIKSFGNDLGRVLNSLWVHSEYVHSPHIPQWEELPAIPRSPKDVNIAMLGSAKSWNQQALGNSRSITAAYHDAGYGVVDGYGGEGHMNEFAQAAVDRIRTGHKTDWRLGITTPLAFIEKEPKGLEGTHLAPNNISMPNKTERMKAIFAQATASHMRPGGLGTTEEGVYNMLLNFEGANCPLIIDSECLPYRSRHHNAYGAFNRMFTDWERARCGAFVVQHALHGKRIIDQHVESERKKTQALNIA